MDTGKPCVEPREDPIMEKSAFLAYHQSRRVTPSLLITDLLMYGSQEFALTLGFVAS
jgi:hypothetical protein